MKLERLKDNLEKSDKEQQLVALVKIEMFLDNGNPLVAGVVSKTSVAPLEKFAVGTCSPGAFTNELKIEIERQGFTMEADVILNFLDDLKHRIANGNTKTKALAFDPKKATKLNPKPSFDAYFELVKHADSKVVFFKDLNPTASGVDPIRWNDSNEKEVEEPKPKKGFIDRLANKLK